MTNIMQSTYATGTKIFPGLYDTYLSDPKGMEEDLEELEQDFDYGEMDYDQYKKDLVEHYKDVIIPLMNEEIKYTGITLLQENVKMISPQYYNYSTDIIVCDMEYDVAKIRQYIAYNAAYVGEIMQEANQEDWATDITENMEIIVETIIDNCMLEDDIMLQRLDSGFMWTKYLTKENASRVNNSL